MFGPKFKKFFRDPNLYFRDFFAKRVKGYVPVQKKIAPSKAARAAQAGIDFDAIVRETDFDALSFAPQIDAWVQMAQWLPMRTGATNGLRSQSLIINQDDLCCLLLHAMFVATRLNAELRIFTHGGAIKRRISLDKMEPSRRAATLASLHLDLVNRSDFCVEFLGDAAPTFVGHVFVYHVTDEGVVRMRSDKAYLRRATPRAFETCYPEPATNGTDWQFDTPYPIDIVFTWVNRDDAGWQELWHSAFPERIIASDRYSSKNELRYSLRSICKFMPWFNSIHIVSNCSKPDWLGDDPRLKWVSHEEIFPDSRVLPNFNSHAIEACLHRIPGLTDRFIYFNDDFFVTQPVYPEDFFDHTGRSITRLEPYGTVFPDNEFDETREYLAPSITSHRLLAQRFPAYRATRLHTHTPYALQISVLREIEEFIAKELDDTRSHRCRTRQDINLPSFFYHHYALATGKGITHRDPSLIVRPQNIGNLIRKRHIENYKFLCFNDGDGSADDRAYLDDFATVMARHFAHSCAFERPICVDSADGLVSSGTEYDSKETGTAAP